MRSVGVFFGDWQGGILQPIDLASVDTAVNALSVFCQVRIPQIFLVRATSFSDNMKYVKAVQCKS